MNSILQNIVQRAPHSQLALVDARLANRKFLGHGTAHASHKWSDMEPVVEAAVAEALENAPLVHDVLENIERYAETTQATMNSLTPPAAPLAITGRPENERALSWAKSWALKLHWKIKEFNLLALRFGDDDAVYVCTRRPLRCFQLQSEEA